MYRQALNLQERTLGPTRIENLMTRAKLANLLDKQGKFEESRPLHTEIARLQHCIQMGAGLQYPVQQNDA